MSKVKNYLSLIKFSHTIFAMPFAFIGFIIGISSLLSIPYVKIHKDLIQTTWQKTNVYLINNYYFFILIVLCMIFARSAAMAFNRYLDRNIDAKNPRTAIREIPKGIITAKNALAFTIVNCILFIACCFFINKLCFYLSPVALAVVLGYSYTKRFTPLCHLILGLGLSLAPIGAYLAVTGQFALLPILFSIAVIFWVSGFDIIYALQDEEFDKSQQLYSIPAWVGKAKALSVSEFLHLLSAATIVFAGYYGNFGWLYWIGTAIFVLMLGYQHSIVKPNDLRRVNLCIYDSKRNCLQLFSPSLLLQIYSSIPNSSFCQEYFV
ncbi:MAG: UbiA family prenyltransferase [Chitinophagaceae bacterium]|nr:UbiA family prenyltransferase [Chitinophagaceae bacterium]